MTESPTIVTGIWSWSTLTAVPPIAKQMRSNTGDWATATTLYVSNTDDSGNDRGPGMDTIKIGDLLRLEHNTDNTRYAIFRFTAVSTARTGYHDVHVEYTDGAGVVPNNGTLLQIIYIPEPPIPEPAPGYMWVRMLMNPYVNEEMATDLMHNMADSMQQVTHMLNYAEFSVNVNGTVLTYEKDILPAVVGDPMVEPVLPPEVVLP
jgi:hypothetical protein